jgi:4-carboxymuconolactone decarboxylase
VAELPDPIPDLRGEDLRTYEGMLARRARHGVGLYGPYVPLLHHPQLAARVEELGGYLKFEGRLPRDRYQFVVLAFAHAE